MEATLGKRCRLLVFWAVSCALVLVNNVGSAEAQVNGVLRQVGNQQVLNLWGGNYEMGYAHGYLLADKIRDLVDHYMIGMIANGSVSTYNALLAKDAAGTYIWQAPDMNEVQGIADGMVASGKNLYVGSLGRNIDVRDVRAFNLQEEFAFGCSGFGAWGNATANGNTIMARNFDFNYDSEGDIANDQIVIAYEPTGMARFVSIAWPGFVGLYSGLNESGVTILDNKGNGSNATAAPFAVEADFLRNIIESTTIYNYTYEPLSLANTVTELPTEIYLIGIPNQGLANPVYVLEDGTTQNLNRYASYTDPSYNDFIVATNHFVELLPPPTSGDTLSRYNTIRNTLINLLSSGDSKVDSTEAFNILKSVANIVAPTLYSMVVRPNTMDLDLSFGKVVNGTFTAATSLQPQTYTWASLFPEHLPDLVVQGISTSPTSPVLGQPVTVTISVKNQGFVDAGAYSVDFYQNLSSAPALHLVGDEYCSMSGLAAGAVDSCTVTATYAAAGTNQMWAQVDTQQQVGEVDESNNISGPKSITVLSSVVLNSLSASPSSVVGGNSTIGTVALNGTAPSQGVSVSLSDNSSAVSVPSSVTVPYGQTSATFTISTTTVTSSRSVTISAVYGGVTKTAAITVTADSAAPTVTSFTIPATASTLTVPVSSLVASDNVGVTGYLISESSTPPAASAAGWSPTAPTSFTFAGYGTRTAYAWAKDAAGNVSAGLPASITITLPSATPGLVAAYSFDEGSGTTVTDKSGNGNNGTISNATWTSTGRYGNALAFNGSNAMVTVANSASLNLSTGMTLEAWVNPTRIASVWQDVIYKGNDVYYLEATTPTSSRPGGAVKLGSSTASDYAPSALSAGSWTHLALTYDGTTVKLYLNGVLASSKAQSGSITSSTYPLQIGGDSIYGEYFSGSIDEVRVYNVALSQAQIQTDMATPLTSTGPDSTAPTVTAFTLPSTASSVTVAVLSLIATDNMWVTGYLITENSAVPSASAAGWSPTAPTSFTFAGYGTRTAYAWAKDAAGNVSAGLPASITITLPSATPGLVAAYSFDEGSGTTVTDKSGNGNNGTISNATWTSTGRYGNALAFNGSNAMVTVANSASLNLSTGMTLEAWVNPTRIASVWQDVIYKGNDVYYLEATTPTSSRPGGAVKLGSSTASDYAPSALSAGSWTHLALTYDGTTVKLYLNGVLASSKAQSGSITSSTYPLQIGGDSIYGEYFSGSVDEVRVYNVALSQAQIQTDMNSGIGL